MSQENHKAELLAYLVIGIIGVFLFFGFVQETEYNSNLRVEVDRTAFNRLSVMNDLSENPERIPDDINLDRCQFSYTINEDQEDRVLAGCSFENRTKPIEVYMHIPGKLTNVSEN